MEQLLSKSVPGNAWAPKSKKRNIDDVANSQEEEKEGKKKTFTPFSDTPEVILEDKTQEDLLNKYINAAEDKLEALCKNNSEGEDAKTYAFSIYDAGKVTNKVILPTNLNEFDDVSTIGLISLIKKIKIPYQVKVCENFKVYQTSATQKFFKSFFQTITRDPSENEKIKFKTKNDSARGTSAAKYLLLKANTADKSALSFLPSEASEGDKRSNILRSFLLLQAGREKPEVLTRYINTFMFVIDLYIENIALPKWKKVCDQYTVPMNVALAGLHKTKKVEKLVNRKKVQALTTISPKRPSTRIEVLSEAERRIIKMEESCFDYYKRLITDPATQATREIKLNNVIHFRKEARETISKMWEVVNKYSPVLTKRMKIYNSLIKEAKLPEQMNAEGMKTFIAYIAEDKKKIGTAKALSPFHIIKISSVLSSNDKDACDIYAQQWHSKYLDEMSPHSRTAIRAWLEMFKYYREADEATDTNNMYTAYNQFNELDIDDHEVNTDGDRMGDEGDDES